ncbi:3-mercaptopyruvate sulfurtransferase [Phyllobacterium leguminum]|uniref:3-mercaptopyruvate sulfurtransferase n=1 Tax=Phyllobacterium leguminum TaxID=314237 RepID=A0A318TJN5_9HYPH|nr:3-mercaptopyruvate sulfurtransferase [Phyllobacterium leguminum]PYE89500.1 thiosulfate/3-mercaptopyruvate sulfurtransferase [Phyllobacterium leguminum]
MTKKSPFVVSADWLEKHLDEPGLSILDASWYLPAQNRDPRGEFDAAHIPGAIFYDQDKIADRSSGLPHTIPSEADFEREMSAMGLTVEDTIIVYDGPGMYTAPRVWWLLRTMGAKNVLVLDGGFDRWKREGRPVTAKVTKIAPSAFIAHSDMSRVASFEKMREIVETGSVQIADARAPGRFSGDEPEPRAGMRSGHMPGARNVPVASLVKDGELKNLEELEEIFDKAGIDLTKPVVTSCGSGVTAAVITLALESLGHKDNLLYDGSWSEWGSRADTPVETGEAK